MSFLQKIFLKLGINKIFIKILTAFLGIMLLFIFCVFYLGSLLQDSNMHKMERKHHPEQNSNTLILKWYIEDKLKVTNLNDPKDKLQFKAFLETLDSMFKSRFWLTSDKTNILLSSSDTVIDIPEKKLLLNDDNIELYQTNLKVPFPSYRIIKVIGQNGQCYYLHVYFHPGEREQFRKHFSWGLVALGLLIFILLYFLSKTIVKPLNKLKQSVTIFSEGKLHERVDIIAKDEFGELGLVFNSMADKIENIVKGTKDITSNISHELRSPLARLRIASELIRYELENKSTNEIEEHLLVIEDEVEYMDELIAYILNYLKADMKESSYSEQNIELIELTNKLFKKFSTLINYNKVNLYLNLPEESIIIKGFPESFQIALSNLIDNAVKYNYEDGSIDYIIKKNDKEIEIILENTYDSKNKSNSNSTKSTQGSGLGFSISKKIIESHNGEIILMDEGNHFKITIKLPI